MSCLQQTFVVNQPSMLVKQSTNQNKVLELDLVKVLEKTVFTTLNLNCAYLYG